ncbi:MAG: DUF1684 domain-containing protein [Bacteroidota bacterium]
MIILCLASFQSFSQDYKTQIELHRKAYANDFLQDKRSPLKENDLKFLRFYDADSTYRITAKVQILADAKPFIMPVFSGTGTEYVPYAVLYFTIKDRPGVLRLYRNTNLAKTPQYSDYLFLPFTDSTNGADTYAGGRYLDFREGDLKDGTVVLDFNKAYNPYCAFGGGYTCPKPPEENHFKIAIEAGEKNFASEVKH